MKMYPIIKTNDHNRYCGPGVIASLTRMSTGEAARLIRTFNGGCAVRGTACRVMLVALAACGINSVRHIAASQNGRNPTLVNWLKQSKSIRSPGRVFLIGSTTHWFLISGRRYMDNIVKEPVSITDDRVARRARITHVYEVTAPNGITIPDIARKPVKTEQQKILERKKAVFRTQAKALIERYNMGDIVEDDRRCTGRYWVSPPDWIIGDDPIVDGHFADTWSDILEIVEVYAKHHPSHPDHANRQFNVVGPCC